MIVPQTVISNRLYERLEVDNDPLSALGGGDVVDSAGEQDVHRVGYLVILTQEGLMHVVNLSS